MDTKLLKYVVEIERAGSISKAAQALYMSQPSLSKALRELESRFGVAIFSRTSRGVTPTVRGARFLREARTVLEQINGMERMFSTEQERGKLRIAAPGEPDMALAFAALAVSLGAVAKVELEYLERDAVGAAESVSGCECEIAVARCKAGEQETLLRELKAQGLKYRLLREQDMGVLMSELHPLAEEKRLWRKRLLQYTEITGDGEKPGMAVQSGGMKLLLLSVATDSYMWSPPLPEGEYAKYGLVLRLPEGKTTRQRDYIIYRNGYKLRQEEEFFAETLKNQK